MAPHDHDHDETLPDEATLDSRTRRLLEGAAAPRPLPAALRERLLALPAAAEAEEEQNRRFERARSAGLLAARSGQPPALPADLPAPLARTERAIAGAIAEARRVALLPAALRRRLLQIGRAERRPLPFYLADVRWAAVACLILTLLSTVLVDEASALLAEKAQRVRAEREEWQVQLGETLQSGSEDAVAALRRAYEGGEEALTSRGEELRDLFEEKLRQFNQTELGRRLAGERSTRGSQHGKS